MVEEAQVVVHKADHADFLADFRDADVLTGGASGYVRIDETRIQVLNSEKAPSALHWMWVRVAGPKHQRIILFDYDPSRGGQVADRLIEGCSGYLQSDGYSPWRMVAQAIPSVLW